MTSPLGSSLFSDQVCASIPTISSTFPLPCLWLPKFHQDFKVKWLFIKYNLISPSFKHPPLTSPPPNLCQSSCIINICTFIILSFISYLVNLTQDFAIVSFRKYILIEYF